MPREITAYACKFHCRRRAVQDKKRMIEHEARCFHNPINRACQTCEHKDYRDGFGFCLEGHNIKDTLRNQCADWHDRVDY